MCKHSYQCWRYAYSKYYLEVEKYTVPPPRNTLFLMGYATLKMMPKRGIFCDNMPTNQCEKNLCPAIMGGIIEDCFEYKKEEKALENLRKRGLLKYQNASRRVDVPKETKRMVAQTAHYKCIYCGKAHGQYVDGKRIKCVVDHFIPLALGGHPTDPSNLVLACSKCNGDKGANIWQKGCRL